MIYIILAFMVFIPEMLGALIFEVSEYISSSPSFGLKKKRIFWDYELRAE